MDVWFNIVETFENRNWQSLVFMSLIVIMQNKNVVFIWCFSVEWRCLARKITSDRETNVFICFLMSENIQFDTKIVFISPILMKIWIFSYFTYHEKGGLPGTIKINDFQKMPKGASLAPSGFGFYNVSWYQIHRDPLWDL